MTAPSPSQCVGNDPWLRERRLELQVEALAAALDALVIAVDAVATRANGTTAVEALANARRYLASTGLAAADARRRTTLE